MRRLIIAYIALLLVGLGLIEWRTGWTIFTNPGSKFPTVVAIIHFLFSPDSLHYVVTGDLKKGHELQEVDLTVYPKLPAYLLPYLPPKNSLVGKYLQRDLVAGKPVREQDLGPSAPIAPEQGSYIVQIRLKQPPSSPRLLESQAAVTLSFTAAAEKLEGIVVGETSARSTPGPTAKAAKTER
jgi:hypothetical protein